jgi:hypothetical protein
MWQFFDNKILYVSSGDPWFAWVPFYVEKWGYSGDILPLPSRGTEKWNGYDSWVQLFPLDEEINLVRSIIKKAQEDASYRGHIRGISLAESVEILRDYYRAQGYEDSLAKNYTLPNTVQVTASISLRHALWCEKDKQFLNTKDISQRPYGMLSPPIRGSHDLRVLQQALRMNILLGIEVYPGDEQYLNMLIEREILPPFSVSQMIQFRWEKYGNT